MIMQCLCGGNMICVSGTHDNIESEFRCKCGITAILTFTIPDKTNLEKFEEKFTRKNIYKIGHKKLRNKI